MAISTINQNGLNAPLTLTAPNLGTPSAINLTNATALPASAMPAGSIIQLVYGTGNTSTTYSSTSYATTGIAATITPQFSNSKIYITTSIPLAVSGSGAYGAGLAIYRGGSAIFTDTNAYDEGYSSTNPSTSNNVFRWGRSHLQYLDSPATTGSTTYTIYCAAYTNTIVTCIGGAVGMITLMEVKQ